MALNPKGNRDADLPSRSNIDNHREQLIENLTVDLLTIEQVAGLLGKKPQTIKNWIARRTFPYVRIGNQNRVRREGLEAWLKRKEFKPWQ